MTSAATTPVEILRRAMPPLRRSLGGRGPGFLSEASAVALACLQCAAHRARERATRRDAPAAVVGVRAFALSRAAFRYTERLASHDAALRQPAVTRTDLVRRSSRRAGRPARTRRAALFLGALASTTSTSCRTCRCGSSCSRRRRSPGAVLLVCSVVRLR